MSDAAHAEPRELERLFVACELDDATRTHLAPQAAERARALGGRAVPAVCLHMTLVFVGATPGSQIEAIAGVLVDACRDLARIRAHQVAIAGVRGRRRSRVVAAVFDDPELRFQAAATAIADALTPHWSITPVPLPFWPHVTLARLRAPVPVPAISARSEQMFAFDRITLYASRSAPSGPAHYVPLARIALTANDRPH